MLRNYLTVAVRNLLRHKTYSLINTLGLSIGVGLCILMLVYLQWELGFDRCHTSSDRIYRVLMHWNASGDRERHALTPTGVGPALARDFPEVAHSVRLKSGRIPAAVSFGGTRSTHSFFFADPGFFRMFTYPALWGNPEAGLSDNNSVVISSDMARLFFGDRDPVGEALRLYIFGRPRDRRVVAVVDVPAQSSVRFDFVLPITNWSDHRESFGSNEVVAYILLEDGTRAEALSAKLPSFMSAHLADRIRYFRGRDPDFEMSLELQPLSDVHLSEGVKYELAKTSDPAYCAVLAAVAIAVLLIACVNFVNLSIGLASTRSLEVGVRKMMGANRKRLVEQFWGEAILLSLISLGIGIAVAELALPWFRSFTMSDVTLDYGRSWGWLLGLVAVVGLLAGSYPALILSGLQPVTVLKGVPTLAGSGRFRRGLMTIQLSLATVLIASAILMARQMAFIRDRNLGFDKDQVIMVGSPSMTKQDEMRRLMAAYRSVGEERPEILRVAAASTSMDERGWLSVREFEEEDVRLSYELYAVGYNYLETMGMEIVDGRGFLRAFPGDANPTSSGPGKGAVVVNETMARELGGSSIIGQRLTKYGNMVVGIVRDFHVHSLHQPIRPLALMLSPPHNKFAFVKVSPGGIPVTLKVLKQLWEEAIPGRPFVYTFVDESLARQYRSEQRWGQVITWATLFGILIACLGSLGLASLSVARRTKEIGIRKVLGASVSDVLATISREFVLLGALGGLIAWPIAYYAIARWLERFAYHVELTPGAFLTAGLLTVGAVLLTVVGRSLRAATVAPVDAIRYE